MQISVQGKQLDVGDALRERIETEIGEIATKYFSDPIESTVTMTKAASQFIADIVVHVGKGITVQSEGKASDAHAAFDAAAERMSKRLRRYKRRLRDHHRGHAQDVISAQQYILAAEIETEAEEAPEPDGWSPVVVAEMETAVDTLTVGEAVMRLDLSGAPALMFRNRGHGGINMIYRRSDGNVGWVDPAGATGAD
ncbi:ribosome-associated translation inhibitor RaiA [Thalassobaculum sp. OXR-137]|uniref:ribosome hibernation-promoting factor, HPF/YfiA family n=1 Tax=Thalassobaculum sp. OXR-137 TaxID=3100173 RepID=UPI002AC9DAAB|nr:ribosome-associated translation inhibitor RaiA [Thalassobaculum sp. OXR-137]WPZ36168.1 ribosome-associated translation inhibitor RaiA [Thalassobaculum sp. OXR-137]